MFVGTWSTGKVVLVLDPLAGVAEFDVIKISGLLGSHVSFFDFKLPFSKISNSDVKASEQRSF